MSHDHLDDINEHDEHEQGLGAGVEEGDLDTHRQMNLERRGKTASIFRNLAAPLQIVKDTFRYVVDHPIKSTAIYTTATAVGTSLSVLGAKLTNQTPNIENILSMGATTIVNFPLAVGAANLSLYLWQRSTDALAGSDYVISHKRVSKAGPITGIALASCFTVFGGNIYGDNVLKTYLSPVLDPLNTGAYVLAAIPDKAVDTFFSSAEGTVLDTWLTPADTAACESRAETTGTAFNLPCRGEYFDGSQFTPFDGYLNEVGDHDGLSELWEKAKNGLGFTKPANDTQASFALDELSIHSSPKMAM